MFSSSSLSFTPSFLSSCFLLFPPSINAFVLLCMLFLLRIMVSCPRGHKASCSSLNPLFPHRHPAPLIHAAGSLGQHLWNGGDAALWKNTAKPRADRSLWERVGQAGDGRDPQQGWQCKDLSTNFSSKQYWDQGVSSSFPSCRGEAPDTGYTVSSRGF